MPSITTLTNLPNTFALTRLGHTQGGLFVPAVTLPGEDCLRFSVPFRE